MAEHTSLGSLFSDIADAIRTKKGSASEIVADDFPDEILSIPAGGGGLNVTCVEYGVALANTATTLTTSVSSGTYIFVMSSNYTNANAHRMNSYLIQNGSMSDLHIGLDAISASVSGGKVVVASANTGKPYQLFKIETIGRAIE